MDRDSRISYKMDSTDQLILLELKKNARASLSEIGEKVGLSRVSVKSRMDRMEENGIILGYTIMTGLDDPDQGKVLAMNIMSNGSKEELYQIADFFKDWLGEDYREKHAGRLKYQIYLTGHMAQTPIDVLELSVRSYNCLKRAGIHTIGDLCEKVRESADLLQIRNCGRRSSYEIMDQLMYYQFLVLNQKHRTEYLNYIARMNEIS